MAKPTAADRARSLHAAEPTLSASQIAARLTEQMGRTVSRQAVQAALRVTGGKRGRPSTGGRVLLRERDLDPRVLAKARAMADEDGIGITHVIVSAVSAGLGDV